jgi:hypothetical protein
MTKTGERKNPEEKRMTSLLLGGITQESMYYYIISRAFIPPWSLVMTKPETLGPDALW